MSTIAPIFGTVTCAGCYLHSFAVLKVSVLTVNEYERLKGAVANCHQTIELLAVILES